MPKNKTAHIHDDPSLKERTQKTLNGWFNLLNNKKARKIATRKVYSFVKSREGLKELSIRNTGPKIQSDELIKGIKNNSVKRRGSVARAGNKAPSATTVYSIQKKRKGEKIY